MQSVVHPYFAWAGSVQSIQIRLNSRQKKIRSSIVTITGLSECDLFFRDKNVKQYILFIRQDKVSGLVW